MYAAWSCSAYSAETLISDSFFCIVCSPTIGDLGTRFEPFEFQDPLPVLLSNQSIQYILTIRRKSVLNMRMDSNRSNIGLPSCIYLLECICVDCSASRIDLCKDGSRAPSMTMFPTLCSVIENIMKCGGHDCDYVPLFHWKQIPYLQQLSHLHQLSSRA